MSDLTTTQIFATAEKNITATKMNNIIGGAVIQPDFYALKPTASSVNPTDQLLILSGGAYAQAPFSTVVNSVGASMGPQITAVRLRSFNAIGNPTFEVDQRNVGNVVTNPISGTFIQDRWAKIGGGTYTVNARQLVPSGGPGIPYLPGTSFRISANWFQVVLTAQQASLAAGDFLCIRQQPEGIRLRELIGDVHSVSLLVASSVAPLTFAVALRDAALPPTRSLIKLCTISTSNTWTLIPLSNLPVFPGAGTFNITPGNQGYDLAITLACGSTLIAPAADTWQTGNFLGAAGMDNFASKAVNSVFYLGFAQHEPGAATTPIDCPWQQNYDDCLRYFDKSYDYATAIGTVTPNGELRLISPTSQTYAAGPVRLSKRMAKVPTLTIYNPVTGAVNSASVGGANTAITGSSGLGERGFDNISWATASGPNTTICHYVCDTGW